jgi:hypothetical protein
MGARATEPLSRSRLCHRARERTSCLLLTAASDRVPRSVSEPRGLPKLPLQALAPARASCAPLFVGVTNSRFVLRGVSPEEKSNNRPSSISATESDARARPELPYLLRTSRPSLRTAVRLFTQMHHAREFPLSVTRSPCGEPHLAMWPELFFGEAVPSAAPSAEPLARLCAAFFFLFFSLGLATKNRESGDVEQLRARRPERCRKLPSPRLPWFS